jgi:uncharacterized protein YdeI (YjbR/CyaY-like superfamily)
MPLPTDVPLNFKDATEWEAWLAKHYNSSAGEWLVITKNGSDQAGLAISDALDVALCFGWIDSQRKGRDSTSYLQRYSRRGPRSSWSRLNVDRADVLIRAGRMKPPGLVEIAAAKADGRWTAAYEPQRKFIVPEDFSAALQTDAKARAAFARMTKSARYALILPILKATSPKLRSARLRKAVAGLKALAPELTPQVRSKRRKRPE